MYICGGGHESHRVAHLVAHRVAHLVAHRVAHLVAHRVARHEAYIHLFDLT